VSDRIELSLRGLPEWLIREYLIELGGEMVEADHAAMTADGWAVSWTNQRVSIPGGSFQLTQFDLVFSGADASRVHDDFMKKAQRGGG